MYPRLRIDATPRSLAATAIGLVRTRWHPPAITTPPTITITTPPALGRVGAAAAVAAGDNGGGSRDGLRALVGAEALVCMSVRSGFDLLLGCLASRRSDPAVPLPQSASNAAKGRPGPAAAWEAPPEVVLTTLTISAMPEIARANGYVVRVVDVDPHTLAPDAAQLAAVLSLATRAVVVAHLFGGRVDLAPVRAQLDAAYPTVAPTTATAVAALTTAPTTALTTPTAPTATPTPTPATPAHQPLLIEDVAQSYDGSSLTRDPHADIALYSFGPIKTATALGGAIVQVRDVSLREQLAADHAAWAPQPAAAVRRRLRGYTALAVLQRELPYTLLRAAVLAAGADFDQWCLARTRSFPAADPADLLHQLRRAPHPATLHALRHRLASYDPARITRRAEIGARVAAALPPNMYVLGGEQLRHTHWVLPIVVPAEAGDPEAFAAHLRAAGFDASTTGATSIAALAPGRAGSALERAVFIPVLPEYPERVVRRLERAVAAYQLA